MTQTDGRAHGRGPGFGRVLGIDCGSAKTGYGVIDVKGREARVVVSGVIVVSARLSFPERLKKIGDEVGRLIET